MALNELRCGMRVSLLKIVALEEEDHALTNYRYFEVFDFDSKI
jgi:hypothetical protein